MTKTALAKRYATTVLSCCLCFLSFITQAQTPAENLQNGIQIYNALREYEDGLVAASITDENIEDVKTRMLKGLELLEKVIKEGTAVEIKAARYFKTNFKYEYLFTLGMDGQNAAAFDICKEIERDMTGYSAADFPISYAYFDKNYVIKWENFAPSQAEYYTGYAEIAYNIKKYEDGLRVNRLAITHPNTSSWLKYIALNKMLDLYDKNNAFLTELEYLDFSLQSVKAYYALTAADHQTITENKYPVGKRGAGIILEKALKNIPAAIARSGEAALISSQGEVNEQTLQLFDIFYRNKQTSDASFHVAAEAYARKASTLNPAKATAVGISATDRMALAAVATDCAGFDNLIEKYTYWKQSTKASEYRKQKEDCLANEAKARKKAARAVRHANRNFNLYAGAYMIPLLKSNAKRDYGAALNFVFKKTAWEFSYLKINQNKENVFDLTIKDVDAKQDGISRWNGFYAHVQPKFFSKAPMYVGFLLGYAQKDFEPLTSNVTHDADALISSQTFSPKTTQYIAMINTGGMGLTKGFGFDMYCGIGATYNQWDRGNTINADEYTFENIILEHRKDQYFSLIVRVGFTMGLNFGSGNLK